MKTEEIRRKSKEECEKLLQEAQDKLQKFYFSVATGKPKNTKEAANLRKNIARIKTISKEKKYEE